MDEYEARWLGGFYCHPLRPANAVETVYQSEFLYDYRRWSNPLMPAEEKLGLVRDYLDSWGVPPGRYHLHQLRHGIATAVGGFG